MRKIIIIISGVMLCVLLGIGLLLEVTFSPMEKARHEAVTLAQGNELIAKVEKFYWYRGEKNVLSLYGQNKDQQPVYVVVIPKEEKAYAYYAQNILSEEQAREISQQNVGYTISSVTLGMLDEQPIWEVILYDNNKHIGYDIISALNGTIIKQIRTE